MGIPEDDRLPPENRHPYGNYSHVSADGKYWFEWTPFTPAIAAWRNAERRLRAAQQHLVEASRLPGFGIVGLEAHHAQFVESVEVFAERVGEAVKEAAEVVIPVLQFANLSYATVADASREEYQQACAAVDGVHDRGPEQGHHLR